MRTYHQFYIDGKWVAPAAGSMPCNVINPATEEIAGSILMGSAADVEMAVAAAHKAFATFSQTTLQSRWHCTARRVRAGGGYPYR